MDGIINVYKEKGFTSHDVVAKLRGILRMKKIGHTGTLDPAAEGVLPVCLGKGTRLCDMLTGKTKTYRAVLLLGQETDTQDTTGVVQAEYPVHVTEEEVRKAIVSFLGDYMQIPPMYSALKVNGKTEQLEVDTRTTLLDALRENLHLIGTKKGCDHGQCGACTVLVNGRRLNACLTLAVMHQGAEITTIEGLGSPDNLHPMQAAFIKHDGFQCGYCTSGQICSSVAVLKEIQDGIPSHVTVDLVSAPETTADEIRERMSGNICRCGAYANILAAIEDAAGEIKS